MKRKLALLITLCILGGYAYAQDDMTGLKGGVNFTNLYVDDVDDENMKIGFNAGIFHRAQISEHFGIQPELLFSQKGSELHYNGSIFTGSGRYRFNLNYLELPLLFVVNFGSFNIHAGPYGAFLVSAKTKDVDDDGDIQEIEDLDRDDFNTFDAGISAGVGIDFPGGIFGIRYNYGLNELGASGSVAGNATNNSKNSALQIYLGFSFY